MPLPHWSGRVQRLVQPNEGSVMLFLILSALFPPRPIWQQTTCDSISVIKKKVHLIEVLEASNQLCFSFYFWRERGGGGYSVPLSCHQLSSEDVSLAVALDLVLR